MSSPLVVPPVAKVAAFYCPNCGGPIELRGFGHALTAVCPQCLSVLDASTPLSKFSDRFRSSSAAIRSSLSARAANLQAPAGNVIGFQTRTVHDDEGSYSWDEYLLFNPYKGFRYLTEYHGHWNFVTPMEPMPSHFAIANRPGGET